MSEKSNSPIKILSFGFRCSSAAILKQMNLKTESYPFDWLISDLSVIKHCIETDFQEFVNPSNYIRKYTNTYEMADSKEGFICDEHLMVNHFYQPVEKMDEDNTYKYKLAMNHHNILEPKDAEYYNRCIQRFRELIINDDQKAYLHIRHLITKEKYEIEKQTILQEIIDFDTFIYEYSKSSLKGLYFILVKDKKNNESFHQELLYESLTTGSKIITIFVNPHFVDAGEIFIGEYYNEVLFIKEQIQNLLLL